MLGAMTMAMSRAASAICAFWSSVNPVVPITALTPVLAARLQVRQRALGPGEVDQDLGIRERRARIGRNRHAAGVAQEGRRVVADGRAGRDVERAGQLAVAGRADGLDQHVAHAAARAGDGHLVHGLRGLGHRSPQRGGGSSGG